MITARIVGAGLEPVNDSFVEFQDGQDDRFDELEQQAAELVASGTKCAIHWHRNTDSQSGYWGPKGVSVQPQWFSPRGRPKAGPDHEPPTKPRSIRLDDDRWEKLQALGREWLERQIDGAKVTRERDVFSV